MEAESNIDIEDPNRLGNLRDVSLSFVSLSCLYYF